MDDLAHHRRRGLYEVCQRLVTAPGAPLGWGVVSAVAVLAGPLGSFEALGFLERLAIWPVVIAVCIAVGSGLRLWVERHVPGEMAQALWLAGLCALVLWLPLHLLTGHMIVDSPAHLPHALTVMALVAVSSLGVSALRGLMARPAGDSGSAPATGPRLLARLAPAQRRPVLRISGRDHYVEATTTAETARLLLRFSDALAELDGTEGLEGAPLALGGAGLCHRRAARWRPRDAASGRWIDRAGLALVPAAGARRGVAQRRAPCRAPFRRPRAGLSPASGTASARSPVSTASASARISPASAGSSALSPPV
ncbi:hypothetical protein SAMN05878426_101581 [Phaeovulum vinaykumarii]|uniref:Uncharacterized protein n=1 Tax=Phaeovulum vinaykumarii TaxID=407234 RepID=A0A1N7K3K6_9RHOB|nr:hypothetical protein SAMN05421795_101583 [Phaeovulum vinaykumarii]SOB92728.1 hypothetical protein SAMN05878426_101581 [Phaeovulum vinaykumarii]